MAKCKVQNVRSDGGTEFKSNTLINFYVENEVFNQTTPPYSPQANGNIERSNRSVVEMARTLISELKENSGIQDCERLWPEAVRTAVFIQNRILTARTHSKFKNKTPFEVLTDKKPEISYLKIYGSKAKVNKPNSYYSGKFSAKIWDGFLVGYGPTGYYRIYLPDRDTVFETKDVIFFEPISKSSNTRLNSNPDEIDLIELDLNNNEASEKDTEPDEEDNTVSQESEEFSSNEDQRNNNAKDFEESISDGPSLSYRTRSGRKVVQTKYMYPNAMLSFMTCRELSGNSSREAPETLKEALKMEDKDCWIKSVYAELKSISEHGVFNVVKRPKNRKIVKNKWVHNYKKDSNGNVVRHKTRLVAKGFSQVLGIDYTEVFSPVTKYETLRFLIAFSAVHDYDLLQYDVKTAFLHSDLEEEIYMDLPFLPEELKNYVSEKLGESEKEDQSLIILKEMIDAKEDEVLKLNKAIYGLKQASLQWYKMFQKILQEMGYKQAISDPCLYLIETSQGTIYLLLYVDDFLLAAPRGFDVTNFESKMKQHFTISSLGEANVFLGIKMLRDRGKKSITLSQEQYIENIAEKFNLSDTKGSAIPMHPGLDFLPISEREYKENRNYPYRELIGCLNYISVTTRPDIAFSVSKMSRYLTNYGKEHWMAAKQILKYLMKTKSKFVTYNGKLNLDVVGYSDADWAGEKATRKSTSGYTFLSAGAVFSWKSKLQTVVAGSTMEAEYISQAYCAREAMWIHKMLIDFNVKQKVIFILGDNNGAIITSKEDKITPRNKHIDVAYHFSRDYQTKGYIKFEYVPSEKMIADCMTQAVQKNKLKRDMKMMGFR